jgi:hypothetical protein
LGLPRTINSSQDIPANTTDSYGYYPSLGFNAFFAAFFLTAALAHAFLGFKTKTYFFGLVLSAGCLTEAIGYAGRIIMHSNPYNGLGFKMQIACLICAPALIAAGIYLNLRVLILTIGESTSLIPARYCMSNGPFISHILKVPGL